MADHGLKWMEAFILFCILIAQALTTLAIIALRKDLDFSKEDKKVKDLTTRANAATDDVNVARQNLPPRT